METRIFFAHPHTLINKVGEILEEVGAEKFFSGPEERIKKVREGLAAYFFTLAMKKHTGKDWWLAQPDQADRSYPDFDFMSFGKTPEDLETESVELTGIYPHFKSFDEALKVIEQKQKKYGPNAVKFSLLVFVNHEKSEEWIDLLKEHLSIEHPFVSIWTIHLLLKKGGQEVGTAVAQRIRPLPVIRVEANIDDPETHKRQPLSDYMEEKDVNGVHHVTFKQEFIDKIMLFRGVSK